MGAKIQHRVSWRCMVTENGSKEKSKTLRSHRNKSRSLFPGWTLFVPNEANVVIALWVIPSSTILLANDTAPATLIRPRPIMSIRDSTDFEVGRLSKRCLFLQGQNQKLLKNMGTSPKLYFHIYLSYPIYPFIFSILSIWPIRSILFVVSIHPEKGTPFHP